MSRLPIVDTLRKHSEMDSRYFAMPGHKMGKAFLKDEIGREFVENLTRFDVTEIDGMDNLHNPSGIIMEAQKQLSDYYKCKKSYFLVNGSTSGNMIMIFSAFNEYDKIIVERNCHRSINSSIILRKLKPVYAENNINREYDLSLGVDTGDIINKIRDNPDAKGIVLTYPNYYGICVDLKPIIKEAKAHGMKVLIDGAHAAHFEATSGLPKSPLHLGCDMAVFSAHKTLPSFTQTSYLHVNEGSLIERADFYFSAFTSTSPSYMFMASLDYARYYLETYGREHYDNLIRLCDKYRRKINETGFYHIISHEDLYGPVDDETGILVDRTRYTVSVPKGYSGHRLYDYLLNNGIQCEMSSGRDVVLIFSPCNDESDFEMLYNCLRACETEELKSGYIEPADYKIPDMIKLPWEAMESSKEEIGFRKAEGRICGQAIVPYPPGVPLIMPGEIITKDIIDTIEYYILNGVNLLGAKDDFISVLDIHNGRNEQI